MCLPAQDYSLLNQKTDLFNRVSDQGRRRKTNDDCDGEKNSTRVVVEYINSYGGLAGRTIPLVTLISFIQYLGIPVLTVVENGAMAHSGAFILATASINAGYLGRTAKISWHPPMNTM